METKTRQTAARLDRFKKADHWSQRRVEEGFAIFAECVFENNRSIKSAWQKFKAINWWHEIKDAFSFLWHESDTKIRKRILDKYRDSIHNRRFAINDFENIMGVYFPEIHFSLTEDFAGHKIEVIIDRGDIEEVHEKIREYLPAYCGLDVIVGEPQNGPDLPGPLNLTPYYTVILVFAAVLIFYGFLAELGFINYAPILK